ncbi:unnamed protein product, partial [Brassica rapa subsp. trilocularis]
IILIQPQTRNKEVVSPLHATATRYRLLFFSPLNASLFLPKNSSFHSIHKKRRRHAPPMLSWEKTKGVIMEAWDEEDKDAYGWIKKDSTTWIGDNR